MSKPFKYFLISFLLIQGANSFSQTPFTLDTDFNCLYPWGTYGEIVSHVEEHHSGKVFIGGGFEPEWGITDIPRGLALLNQDGSLNESFNSSILNLSYIFQAYHSIFELREDTLYSFISRLLKTDMSGNVYYEDYYANIDSFFDLWDVNDAILEDDGSVLVSGWFRKYNSVVNYDLVKILPDGQADTSFIIDAFVGGFIREMHQYSEDKLIVHGRWNNWLNEPVINGNFNRISLIDGSIDTTFQDIFTFPSYMFIHDVLPDGKIIMFGRMVLHATYDTIGIARLNPDGSLDTTFNNLNNVEFSDPEDCLYTMCSTADGGYLVGGVFSNYQGQSRGSLVKIDSNGFLDTTALNGLGIDQSASSTSPYFGVRDIKETLDGKYYVCGSFDLFNGEPVSPIIRLHGNNLGMQELTATPKINIYPNPASDFLQINLPVGVNEIRIYSFQSRLIEIYPNYGTKKRIDVSNYQNGLYIIQARCKDMNYEAKFIISKF